MKTKVLCICTGNKDRSPTAAAICSQFPNLEVRSAGTSLYAINPLTEDMVCAADVLVVMEREHAEHIREHYPEALDDKPLYCLDIPDEYRGMAPELMCLLKEKLAPILEEYRKGMSSNE